MVIDPIISLRLESTVENSVEIRYYERKGIKALLDLTGKVTFRCMEKVDFLDEFLKETKEEIDGYIFDFLPQEHERLEVGRLYEMMRDYPMRSGKRLRPALCLLICEAFGGKPQEAFKYRCCTRTSARLAL